MPEATMDQHDGVITPQHYIRAAGQVPAVEAEPESGLMEQAAHEQLWLRVRAANATHHPAAGRGINNVSHRSSKPHLLLERAGFGLLLEP